MNGEDNIGTAANLTIAFNEDIAFGTGNIFIYQSGVVDPVETFDVSNPGSGLSISGATLTINPTGDLDSNTTYYIEIENTAIEDLAGNPFGGISGSGTWSFTTSDPASTILFDFDPDGTNIATDAVSVTDLSSPVNGNGVTLAASVGNNTSSSRDRGANTGPSSDLTRDFIQWNIGGPITITISGLASDQEYGFRLWSGDMAGGQIKTTDHTIAGASGGGTIRHISVSLADEQSTGGSLVELPNVVSTSTGTLTYTIDYVGGGGTAATLNGFELVVISASDTTAPTLSTTTPAHEATDVSPSVNLVATFDEEIAAGSGIVTIKNLTDATESAIDITDGSQLTISGTFLTIHPGTDLARGKNYAARIASTAIEDTSGNAFGGISDDSTWNFSTVSPSFSEWIGEFDHLGGLTAFDDDPDGDGHANGIENFFGTHPGESSRGLNAGEIVVNDSTSFSFTHPLNPFPTDTISANYRWSKDLSNFRASGIAFEGTTVTFGEPGSPDAEGIVTVTATITGTPIDRLFVDVEVTEQ